MFVLQALREQRGWSKAELARRSGMHPATVGLIESGRLVPYQGQLLKLEQALGLPVDRAEQLIQDVGQVGVTEA